MNFKVRGTGGGRALQQKPIFESTATTPMDEGEGDEPHYRERGNEDLLQLKCAECAAEEETVQRLESTDATQVVPDDFSSQLRSNKGSGSRSRTTPALTWKARSAPTSPECVSTPTAARSE